MRSDKQKDLDRYYNDHRKLQIVRRLMMVETWEEIEGINAAVYEAINREEDAENKKREEFENWKKSEAFRKAHSGGGQHQGIYLGHPEFEGFEVIL